MTSSSPSPLEIYTSWRAAHSRMYQISTAAYVIQYHIYLYIQCRVLHARASNNKPLRRARVARHAKRGSHQIQPYARQTLILTNTRRPQRLAECKTHSVPTEKCAPKKPLAIRSYRSPCIGRRTQHVRILIWKVVEQKLARECVCIGVYST